MAATVVAAKKNDDCMWGKEALEGVGVREDRGGSIGEGEERALRKAGRGGVLNGRGRGRNANCVDMR